MGEKGKYIYFFVKTSLTLLFGLGHVYNNIKAAFKNVKKGEFGETDNNSLRIYHVPYSVQFK